MKPILSLFLCLFAATAFATDPPTYAPATTKIAFAANPQTVTVREISTGKYGGEKFIVDETIVSPIYPLSSSNALQLSNAMAAKIDQSHTFVAITPSRGNPIDPKDTCYAVARVDDAMAVITLQARDLPVLVVDEGDGKFSGQVVVGSTTYTYPIYQASTTVSATHVSDDLAGKGGEIVTLRTVICQRNTADRVLLVLEVLD